ncbi:hypothetical protein BS47DRAFT_683959 [Hydnum rufescens UP504]|uniref:Uncharacterized protein n=1 Tax=Hydnum rufescens UP504 TaxID=1448309 RepID=A0A9P6DYW8_9AGAM|nr:hypothetical protein BS47DRAFT_683959 [Hydnum rufescens UP504]
MLRFRRPVSEPGALYAGGVAPAPPSPRGQSHRSSLARLSVPLTRYSTSHALSPNAPHASCSPIPSRDGAISSRHTNFQSGRAYLGSDRFRCISSGLDWWPSPHPKTTWIYPRNLSHPPPPASDASTLFVGRMAGAWGIRRPLLGDV